MENEKIKNIEDVQNFLNGIESINRGGCAISALSMYKWLKNSGYDGDVKFVYMYDGRDRYVNNSNVLRDGEGVAQAATHCCLLYNGKFIDSTGNIDLNKFSWVQIIEKETFIKKSIKNKGDWNHSLNRANVKKIEEELNIKLGKLD